MTILSITNGTIITGTSVQHPEVVAEISSQLLPQYQKLTRGPYHPVDAISDFETGQKTCSFYFLKFDRPYIRL
jgi:hypothetical protein